MADQEQPDRHVDANLHYVIVPLAVAAAMLLRWPL